MSEYQNYNHFWWMAKKDHAHDDVQTYIKKIRQDQHYRQADNLKFLRLYGNSRTLGFGLKNYSRVNTAEQSKRVTLNVIQSTVDTAQAKITKNQPRPMFLTEKGNWKERHQAKKLNQFVLGQFYHNDIYKLGPLVFRDAAVFGTGCLKIFEKDNDTCVERVFVDDITIDEAECMYGEPRQMHHGMWVHKEVLKATYASDNEKLAKQIDNLSCKPIDEPFSQSDTPGMVRVVESWKLASGKDANDGRRTITVDGLTLLDDEYDKDHFPFVFFKWSPKLLGFWGQGLAEQLQGLQIEINKILRTVQLATDLCYIPRVLIERNSKVVSEHINNRIGAKVYYTGVKPEFWIAAGALPPELFQHLDRLYQRAFEIAGISQLSAQAKKPSGLDSGKALRTFNDIESERFLDVSRRYENFYTEIAEHLLDVSRDIVKRTGSYTVRAPGSKFLRSFDLAEIDLSEDRYVMQMFPISAFSDHPASRLQQVQEAVNTGMMTPAEARKAMAFPDTAAEDERANSPFENLDWVLERILDKGEYNPPEPYQKIDAEGIAYMQKEYLLLQTENAPEDKLEMVRNWITDAEMARQKAEAEAMAEQQQQLLQAGGVPPEQFQMALQVLQGGGQPTQDQGAQPPMAVGQ